MARVTGVPLSYLLSRGQQVKVISQLLRKVTNVCHQLHGDGQGHRGTTVISTVPRSAGQGHLTASTQGKFVYRISGIFGIGLIFAEFATFLKSPKIDTAKNKPYCTSSLIVLEIAKIGLSENLTHLPSVIFAKIF